LSGAVRQLAEVAFDSFGLCWQWGVKVPTLAAKSAARMGHPPLKVAQ